MLTTIVRIVRNRWFQLIGLPAAVIAALVTLAVVSGFVEDLQQAYRLRNVWQVGSAGPYQDGISTTAEMVVRADVVAVANLVSVNRGVGKVRHSYGPGVPYYGYTKILEFTFEVEEYLKGQGKERIVAVVTSLDPLYRTTLGAQFGKPPDKNRRTDWDDRRAVVFLEDYSKISELGWQEGRYWMGEATDIQEFYSMGSVFTRPWIPAVSEDPNEERFLLRDDKYKVGRTVSLDDLKGVVVQIEGRLASKSEEYVECVQQALARNREAESTIQRYLREDAAIGSGLPKDTHVYTTYAAPYRIAPLGGEPIPEGFEGRYQIDGRDQEYFYGEVPGLIYLERPLPAGEYRIFHAFLPYFLTACGATAPASKLQSREIFISVTGPEGIVHEALFDPVQNGERVAGTLKPAMANIGRIAWEAGTDSAGEVTLRAASPSGLDGQTFEFIALDGQTILTLRVADATAQSAALVWELDSQPWQHGDKLMVRITES